jgi:hypothetical protein
VIEGVRVLPWFHDAVRRNRAEMAMFLDCESCMENNPEFVRREMGCGYVPGAIRKGPGPDGFEGTLTTCVGYTTKLPEVVEVSRARLWWDKGQLREWCEGDDPTPALRLCIEELEAQVHAVTAHATKPKGSS